jgi:hypothetical protein
MKTLKQAIRLLAALAVGFILFAVLFVQLSDLVKAMPLAPSIPSTTESSLMSTITVSPWVTKTAMPTERATTASAVVDGMVNVPGDYQTLLGCSDNWLPDCSNTAMTEIGNNQWSSGPFALPAGSYECKVALDGSWAENYGLGGVPDGPNIPFSLDRDGLVSFVWDEETKILTIVKYSVFLPTVIK